MAVTSKVTCSLKPQTVERVAELAAEWGVPRSEVVRRAVDKLVLEQKLDGGKKETPLEVFQRLQSGGGISAAAAAKSNAEVRRRRRASGIKRG